MLKLKGLTELEVEDKRIAHGSNKLTEKKQETFWEKLKDNFNDPIMKILCVALIVNMFFAYTGQVSWYETLGIAAAILIATMLSTYSEMSSADTFRKLQAEADNIICKVKRNGVVVEKSINDLVVDDVILLQAGDLVPVDGVVIDGSIKVDQSALNGESEEVLKTPTTSIYPEDRNLDNAHFVARGSIVTNDNCYIKAIEVGDKTIYGHIAKELQEDNDRKSPLTVKLTKLADGISKFGYFGGSAIALALLFHRIVVLNNFDLTAITMYCSNYPVLLNDLVHALILAIIIIVMAVPEGLPLMIAIVSSLNMRKMLRDNVLVRKLSGIETAGSLNILFSDKTGTITKGQLAAITFISASGKENGYTKTVNGSNEISKLLYDNVVYNTAAKKSNKKTIGGNMTERALLGPVELKQDDKSVVKEISFNSSNKYSAAMLSDNVTYIKGAPEKIINRCKYCYGDNDEGKQDFTNKEAVYKAIDELTSRAMRVLAFATSDAGVEDGKINEGDWTFVGIVGIRDDIRSEAITAIKEVQEAGIQVVMITGDNIKTAESIAADAGLITKESDISLTSDELAEMSDEEIANKLPNIKVIARALPSDKSRLVRIAQSKNLVVGMTGDGVNDSPALKAADVGFGMGSGTEVAKSASEIIILDDNFKSIAKAILYGRTIYNNIRKFIQFQLTINVTAVLICLIAPFINIEYPLSVTQILWVNLIMDTLAAIALGGEPALKEYMKERPKRRDENIISRDMGCSIAIIGAWVLFISLNFLQLDRYINAFENTNILMTGYFALFVLCAVVNAFNTRTTHLNVLTNINQNKQFILVMVGIVFIQVVMTYIGGDILRCYGLNLEQWLLIAELSLTVFLAETVRKVSFSFLE